MVSHSTLLPSSAIKSGYIMDPSSGSSMGGHSGQDDRFEDSYPQSHSDGQDPFTSWLNKDRPWHPMGANICTPNDNSQHSHLILPEHAGSRSTLSAFHVYRNPGQPSDCDTVPGDSGYGSCLPGSVENTSVYGDGFSSGVPDVENEFSLFHLNMTDIQASNNTAIAYSAFQISPSGSDTNFICNGCHASLRTKSELNKHLQRHDKPHHCLHSECMKAGIGFASNNDLIRHRRSVHGERLNGPLFICRHGACVKKDPKQWPRADNFRSHLQRVHKIKLTADDGLNSYLCESHKISEDLEGVGTNLQDPEQPREQALTARQQLHNGSIAEFPEISSQVRLPPSAQASLYNDKLLVLSSPSEVGSGYIQPKVLSAPPPENFDLEIPVTNHLSTTDPSIRGSFGSTVPNYEPERRGPSISYLEQSTSVSLSLFTNAEACSSEMDDNASDIDIKKPPEINLEPGDSFDRIENDMVHGLLNTDRKRLLDILKSLPKDVLESALDSQMENHESALLASFTISKGKLECQTCNKTFNRPCELRKHSKRHEKPYGCTWNECGMTFGSKNDWKRHETNRHEHVETWHCDQGCTMFFNSTEGFRAHLQRDHHLTDSALIESKLEDNRLGSHCRVSFWCGFCEKLFEKNNEGADISGIRFDHIDDHFMGRHGKPKQRIKEWSYMEKMASQCENFFPSPTSTPTEDISRKRKRNTHLDCWPSKQSFKLSA